MSLLTLQEAKEHLDVLHGEDDIKLQTLIDGAEEEALQFMNRTTFVDAPAEDRLRGVARVAVLLLLEASYNAAPDDSELMRKAAEVKLMPMRIGMGV